MRINKKQSCLQCHCTNLHRDQYNIFAWGVAIGDWVLLFVNTSAQIEKWKQFWRIPLFLLYKALCVPSPSFFSLPAGVFGLSSVALDNDDVNVFYHIYCPLFSKAGASNWGFWLGPVSLFLGPVGFLWSELGPSHNTNFWCEGLNGILSFYNLHPPFGIFALLPLLWWCR